MTIPADDYRLFIVYANWSYKANETDEISFKKGDPLIVLEKDYVFGDGWWQGYHLKGTIGLFPSTYITFQNILNVAQEKLDELVQIGREILSTAERESLIESPTYLNSSSPATTIAMKKLKNSESSSNISLDTDNASIYTTHSHLRDRDQIGLTPRSESLNAMKEMHGPSSASTSSCASSIKSNYSNHSDYSFISSSSSSSRHRLTQNPRTTSNRAKTKAMAGSTTVISPTKFGTSLNQEEVKEWSQAQVNDWLKETEIRDSAKKILASKEVDGKSLVRMSISNLRSLGITSLTDRIQILHHRDLLVRKV